MTSQSTVIWRDLESSRKNRIAIVKCDADLADTFKVQYNGTDSNGDYVRANFVTIDNFNSVSPLTVFNGLIESKVSPYTRTTFELPVDNQFITISDAYNSFKLTFSERNLGIPNEQNQLASGSAFDMAIYYPRDGTSPMLANVDFGNFKGTNVAAPTLASDAVNKAYADNISLSVNVMEAPYNCKLDGVTDDTVGLQAACDFAASHTDFAGHGSTTPFMGKCEVIIPQGYMIITDKIRITKSVSIRGVGHSEASGGARICQNTANRAHFEIDPIAQGASVSFKDMTMICNGNGNTGGSCIDIKNTIGQCNSIRIVGVTFVTPQNHALKVKAADDIYLENVLIDQSALQGFSLGTAAPLDQVTRLTCVAVSFFEVASKCILPYNVKSMEFIGTKVYHQAANRTDCFIDGYNTLPYFLGDIIITGGCFEGIDCFINASAVQRLIINGITAEGFGAGGASTRACIELTGACDGVTIINSQFNGNWGPKNWFNDTAAAITGAVISHNKITGTGTTVKAIECSNTQGIIGPNYTLGFAAPSIGEKITTTGNAINPGNIATGGSFTYQQAVSGIKVTDRVTVDPVGGAALAAIGIVIKPFPTAGNINIRYENVTGGVINVPAHDASLMSLR